MTHVGNTIRAGLIVACCSTIACGQTSRRAAARDDKRSATTRPAGARVVAYDRGIRIDYRAGQVEIDGEVILREGPLELFAYAKASHPKEHESILLLRSRPLRIYEALGLIGARPGQTSRFFWETNRVRKSSGDPIDVLVRYESSGKAITVSAWDWMLNAQTKKPVPPRPWLFTGSERFDDGMFHADVEGTVVTVVDFTSSLVGLPEPHSDSDAALWLIANTAAIPPAGTKVTLILRPAPTSVVVRIEGAGRTRLDGEPVDRPKLVDAIKRRTAGWTDRAVVTLNVSAGVPSAEVDRIRTALREAGVDPAKITTREAARGAPGDPSKRKSATSRPSSSQTPQS